MVVQTVPGRPDQVWVEDDNARFVLLGSRGQILRGVDLEDRAEGGPQGDLVAIYQWVPLGGSEFFVFGDVLQGDYGTSVFFRVPHDQPAQFQVIEQVALTDPGRRFYLLGMPFIAAVDGVPYYLVMGEVPYLTSPGRKGDEKLAIITLDQGKRAINRPQLPEEIGRRASRDIFRALAQSTFPAGLFGWHGSLYVLVHSSQGRNIWTLLKLDPRTGKTLWQRRIESTANHLTVVPGEQYWAFIERGRLEEAGVQEFPSFLRVPASQLDR
jgi:hypothetical protein